MEEDLDGRLHHALGQLCPACGAVMEEIVVVSNTKKSNALRCPFCRYRESACD
jgi:DNA-directed RNA polymerase subunit RPC12/RpoP